MNEALLAWVEAHRAPMSPARAQAAARLQAQGADAVAPVLAACRAGHVDATACFTLLCAIEPWGLRQAETSAERDDAEGAAALRALAGKKPLPAGVAALLPTAWRAESREKRLAGLWATIQVAPRLRLELGSEAEDRLRVESAVLLDALQEPDLVLANLAAQAIGLLKPPAAVSVPALTRVLEAALQEQDRHGTRRDPHHLVAALGAYGPEAEAAIPLLVLILKRRGAGAVTAAFALAEIGAAAVATLPELKAVRDVHEGRSKSETKAFRTSLGKAIRQLEAAGEAPRARKGTPIEGDPYLLDLLGRMSSPASLLTLGSSASSPSFRAHREAETLSDPALIPRLVAILTKPLPARMFEDGLFVLGHLARRTGAAAGGAALLDLARQDLPPRRRQAVVDGLARSRSEAVRAALLEVVRQHRAGRRVDLYHAIEALADHAGEDDVSELVALALDLEADFHHAYLAVLALNGLAHPASRAGLESLLAHPGLGRGREKHREVRAWAIETLGAIGDACSVPVLARELEADPRGFYPWVAQALARIDREEARPHVLRALREGEDDLRRRDASDRRELGGYLTEGLRYLERHGGLREDEHALVASLESLLAPRPPA